MAVEPERMLRDLRALAELTGTDGGTQRVAWTDTARLNAGTPVKP